MADYQERSWPGIANGATRAERRSCAYRAYLPDPLIGRALTLPAEVAADVVDVEAAVRNLQSERPGIVNLESLARLLLRAEAVASSYIEGLQINVRRLAKEAASVQSGLGTQDATARAVLGNVTAMESALDLAGRDGPVTIDDVRELHAQLLAGTRDEQWGGVVRTEQNWVGGPGNSPCTAEYVPPPPEHVESLLEDLCAYISDDDHPALVQAALTHAQFETIHPFLDGNGRTGRALIHLVLRRRGLASAFVPPISLVLATHAQQYVGALTAFRYTGSVSSAEANQAAIAFLEPFLADTARACADADAFAARIADLEEQWRAQVGRVRRDSATDLLLRRLAAVPVITVATAAALIDRSVANTNKAVNVLVEAGVLRQTSIGNRNRAFEVPDLVGALTSFERALASPVGDTEQAKPVRPVPARPVG